MEFNTNGLLFRDLRTEKINESGAKKYVWGLKENNSKTRVPDRSFKHFATKAGLMILSKIYDPEYQKPDLKLSDFCLIGESGVYEVVIDDELAIKSFR